MTADKYKNIPHEISDGIYEMDIAVTIDYSSDVQVSPYLFGDNLEHTRGCINGGLSAEILRNRKFVGKPCRYGHAHEWYAVGEKMAFSFGDPYTRHADGYRMSRSHEINGQIITNFHSEKGGIGQKDLYLAENTDYIFTAAVKAFSKNTVTVSLIGKDGEVCDSKVFEAV